MGLQTTGSGSSALGEATATGLVITDASAAGLEVGPNGSTNPVLRVVDNVASQATGLSVTGNAAGSGVTLAALSSGSNEGITLTPKGSGNLLLSSGRLQIGGTSSSFPALRNTGSTLDAVTADAASFTTVNASKFQWANGVSLDAAGGGALLGPQNSGAGSTFRFVALSPSQLTADQNNYAPGGSSYFIRLSSDASRTLTGLSMSQVDGETHLIVNVGSNNIVLAHESGSSTAANRFTNSTGADITLSANQAADLIYDNTSSRWRVFKRN